MTNEPLVSIITPCFNGGTFLHRYFESILAQTYSNIELIFINDGSTDQTEEIALSYQQRLAEKGVQYHYIYQKNRGLPASINRGLEVFSGEYLTWPDSDDWMSPDCIEQKVHYLSQNQDKGLVLCQTAVVDEQNLDQVIDVFARSDKSNEWIFENLLQEKGVALACGGYMVRTDCFLRAVPTRRIYDNRAGQNWQMLLPVSHRYPCGFIDKVLYYYVIREDSHSRQEKAYSELVEKTYRHQDILEHVLHDMSLPEHEREEYLRMVTLKYARKRLHLAGHHGIQEDAKDAFQILRAMDSVDFRGVASYLRTRSSLVDFAYRSARALFLAMQTAKNPR